MSGTFRPYGLIVAHQAPLSMGFSRQEYWSGLSCPPPEDPPHPGIKSASLSLLHCQAGSLPLAPLGKAHVVTQLWSKPEERFLLAQFLLSGENPVPRPICRITFAFSFWGCHIPSSETIIENEHRSTVIDGDWVRLTSIDFLAPPGRRRANHQTRALPRRKEEREGQPQHQLHLPTHNHNTRLGCVRCPTSVLS